MPTFEELTGSLLDHELRTNDASLLFTSTRRAAAVNEGQAEFCELTECLIRQSTIVCSCNTAEYDLNSSAVMSTDFVRIAPQGVEWHLRSSGSSGQLTILAGDDFPRRDIGWRNRYESGWRWSTTPASPTGYYLRADGGQYLIGLDYPPDIGSSETGTLIVPYIARPVPMTSTGDRPFTVGGNVRNDLAPFHRALVHYAAHQLEKLRGDDQASDRAYAKFLQYVTRFTEKMRHKGGTFITFGRAYLREARTRDGNSGGRGRDPYRSWP